MSSIQLNRWKQTHLLARWCFQGDDLRLDESKSACGAGSPRSRWKHKVDIGLWKELMESVASRAWGGEGDGPHHQFSWVVGPCDGWRCRTKFPKQFSRNWAILNPCLCTSGPSRLLMTYVGFTHRLGARYVIKPKATPIYFQYSAVTSNYKYTNLASAFTSDATWHWIGLGCCYKFTWWALTKELEASRVLTKIWRVMFQKESNVSHQHYFVLLLWPVPPWCL